MTETESLDGHTLWWMTEGGKIIDWEIEHPKNCMETYDRDGPQNSYEYPDCAITFVTDGEGYDYFEEYMLNPGDGEFKQPFRATYSSGWDYFGEFDYDFDWEPVGDLVHLVDEPFPQIQ